MTVFALPFAYIKQMFWYIIFAKQQITGPSAQGSCCAGSKVGVAGRASTLLRGRTARLQRLQIRCSGLVEVERLCGGPPRETPLGFEQKTTGTQKRAGFCEHFFPIYTFKLRRPCDPNQAQK